MTRSPIRSMFAAACPSAPNPSMYRSPSAHADEIGLMFEDPSGLTVAISATGVPKYNTGRSTLRVVLNSLLSPVDASGLTEVWLPSVMGRPLT